MAAVLKGYFPQQSLPVGLEKRMAGLHPDASVPSRSSRGGELSELSCLISEEEEGGEQERESDADYEMVQREEAADMPPEVMLQGYRGYGAVSPDGQQRKRRKRRRHHRRPPRSPLHSLSPHPYHEHHHQHNLHSRHRRFYSTTALTQVKRERERGGRFSRL